MATLTSAPAHWANTQTRTDNNSIWHKWLELTESQKKNRTFWFLLSLVFQGVFFLPIPAALTFYFHAPSYIIAVTLVLFFANVIAGMGGNSIRTLLNLLALSTLVHLVMVLFFVL
jgi:hypothetical protein